MVSVTTVLVSLHEGQRQHDLGGAVLFALAGSQGFIGVLARGAALDAAGHIFLVRQRALVAGVRRVAVVIHRRIRLVVVYIGQRRLGRIAKIAVAVMAAVLRSILAQVLGILRLARLLAAADDHAVAVIGRAVAGLRHGAHDLRLRKGAAHAAGLILHLGDSPAARLAACLKLLQLVGQLGAVKLVRIKCVVCGSRRCGRRFILGIKLHHLKGGLLFVHALLPGELLLLNIFFKRRAAAGALGQIRCVPCAALGAFHFLNQPPNIV